MTNGPKEVITIQSVASNKGKDSAAAVARKERRREKRKLKREAKAQAAGTQPSQPRARQTAPGGLGGYPTKAKLTRFAASIVWPAQTGIPAVRYSDPGQTSPTALGRPWTQIEAPWGDGDTTQTLSFQVFRSAARAYAIDFPYNTDDYLYDVYGTDSSASSSEPPKLIPTLSIPPTSKQDFHGAFAVAQSLPAGFQPHGTKVFAGFPGRPSRGVRFFWMEAGTSISGAFTLTSGGTAISVDIYIEKWSFTDSFEIQQLGSFSVDGGVLTPFAGAILQAGWYGLSVFNGSPSTETYTVQWSFAGAGQVLGQRCMPFLTQRIEELEQFHVTSIAGRYENTGAPNFRAGKVAVYQVPAEQDNMQFVRNYTKVAEASGSWSEEATEGSYGWLRPVDEKTEMKLISEFRIENDQIYDSFWDLGLPCQYKTFSVRVPAQTTTGGNPKSGVWWIYANVEYVTESPWPAKETPSKDYKSYEKAISELAEVNGASTNKSHLKLLESYAKKFGSMFSTPQRAVRNGSKIARDVVDTITDIAN